MATGFSEYSSTEIDPILFFNKVRDNLTGGGGKTWYQQKDNVIDNTTVYKILLTPTNAVDDFLVTDPTQTYNMLLVATKTTGSTPTYSDFSIYFGDDKQISFNDTKTDIIVTPSTMQIQVFGGANVPTSANSFSYQMAITTRGWALSFWSNARTNSATGNSILAIQRPINPTSGQPKTAGTAPIFAFWRNISAVGNEFNWGTVREKDTSSSYTYGRTNVVSRYNMYKISTDWAFPNVFDNTSHVVKFPYGFATSRNLYLDEIDLICIVSSASYSALQDIKITMYGELDQRKYKATYGFIQYGGINTATSTFNTNIIAGIRLGVLYENGGITQ